MLLNDNQCFTVMVNEINQRHLQIFNCTEKYFSICAPTLIQSVSVLYYIDLPLSAFSIMVPSIILTKTFFFQRCGKRLSPCDNKTAMGNNVLPPSLSPLPLKKHCVFPSVLSVNNPTGNINKVVGGLPWIVLWASNYV